MSDRLALDLTLSRDGDNDVRNLAAGMHQLHQRAARDWPGRRYTQTHLIKEGVMTVELHAFPDRADV